MRHLPWDLRGPGSGSGHFVPPGSVGLTAQRIRGQAKGVSSRCDPRHLRRLGKGTRHALGLTTVLAMTLATLFGGHRYLYCRPMNRIVANTNCPCARAPKEAPSTPALGVVNDCYEVRVLHRLVSFTVASDLAVPPATLLVRLPPTHFMAPQPGVLTHGADQPIRAGPFSPAALRAQLMVFLT